MDLNNRYIIKLLKGCRSNKREDQKALYQHFYSYCLGICMRYAKSRDDAVEMMNDGYMSVFSYIDKFDLKRPFKPWLRKIMVNSAIDHLKKNSKIHYMENLESGNNIMIDDTQLDSVSYDDLIEMIRKLPPAYATVFNMRAIEGYKHEEVAEILGISVGTSKSNYAKARAKLQEYVAIYFGVKQ